MIRRVALSVAVAALPLLVAVASVVAPAAAPAAASSTSPAYWLVASDGGIFAFGGAPYYGSTGGMALNKPVVGMAATPDGGGYWLVASDGGIFSFGDASFYGSTGGMRLNQPVVGMAATPDGRGYWLVASDGGIFAFGDAKFYGSTGGMTLNKPIVAMLPGPGGNGYFLVASDGGVFSFGSAPFYGSLGGQVLKNPIVAAVATPTGNGYWFTDSAGLVSNFGAAEYYGSAPTNLFRPIVGMADAPGNGSFVGAPYPSGAYGYDVSVYQCNSLPTGAHEIGIVQVDGQSSGNTNPCLAQQVAWAGGGLNLYTFLTYTTSASPQPGCLVDGSYDQACNAGYLAGIHAFDDAQAAGADTSVAWWLDVEVGSWSSSTTENALFVQGALNALHETEGIADVGIYASPANWNSIVGDYQPDVPYWMADYLANPSGPGSCAAYATWAAQEQLPTGPLQIVQYNSATYDEDYAC
ncbi:MAG TPA: hypothetical protein VEG62_04990 [Acidimicrobiales bacterium]|nr:hypothetical protein [Acidimicrobiales bacterium]